MLYVYAGLGLRQCSKAMEVFNYMLQGSIKKVPAYTTVKTWVEKAGLSIYKNRSHKEIEGAYAAIVDGSISSGDQQLMLLLKVSSKPTGHAITHEEQEIIGMKVNESWKAGDVKKFMEDNFVEVGQKADYAISDCGSNLRKALADMNMPSHRDISHSFGTFLKNVYAEDENFKAFMEDMGKTRRYALTSVAYLMPPKQRSIARFMNMFNGVDWAKCLIDNFFMLNRKEKYYYSFLQKHSAIINELHEVMSLYETVLNLCKNKGLSIESAGQCKTLIKSMLLPGCGRMVKLRDLLTGYFDKETALLISPDEVHNISSDIIETDFGCLKGRMAANKNCGFTTLVLILPLMPKLQKNSSANSFDIKSKMEDTTMEHIKRWKRENLRMNPMSKRREKMEAKF